MVQEILLTLQEPWSGKLMLAKNWILKPLSQIRQVALKWAPYSPIWFVTFTISTETSRVTELYFTLLKYSNTFDSLYEFISFVFNNDLNWMNLCSCNTDQTWQVDNIT